MGNIGVTSRERINGGHVVDCDISMIMYKAFGQVTNYVKVVKMTVKHYRKNTN